MSILFVLLTFLVILVFNYFYFRAPQQLPVQPEAFTRKPSPMITKELGFAVPQGYSFHPGHTWAAKEGGENVRVGLDNFAADLIGKVDKIEIASPRRWVRQGQRLMTLQADGVSMDLLSPVEGVVMAVNQEVVKDPAIAMKDPYKDGWVAVLKSPDLPTNQKNLLQGPMVAPWMNYSMNRLTTAAAGANPALAQDGGVPIKGFLLKAAPELRQKLIQDFFLS
jgi:glycine cleavage system H lipoate-binding protein